MSGDVASIRQHPRGEALAALVRTLAWSAADERSRRLGDGLDELMLEAELKLEDGVVTDVNLLETLARVAEQGEQASLSTRERRLLAEALALGIAQTDQIDAPAVAARLCWLAANTWLDATTLLDEVLALDAEPIWQAMRELCRGAVADGRGEALVALAALRASSSPAAEAARAALCAELDDPLLLAAASAPDADARMPSRSLPPAVAVEGSRVATPLGPLGLLLQGPSGILLLRWLARFAADVVLQRKRPLRCTVDKSGVTLAGHTEIVGRTLSERELHIPYDNLARVEREVRFPRLGTYAGLLTLALGTFLGVSLMSDGARAASPSLILLGVAVLAVGVVLDLVFTSLLPSRAGRPRLVFTPRKGRALCMETADDKAATRLLQAIAQRSA